MRTEQEVLNDFEKLGYEVIKDNDYIYLKQHLNYINEVEESKCIYINFKKKQYSCLNDFYKFEENVTMQEHKLLTDLFKIWGWL